jgi:uncharacterized protein (TIGR03067 family)
MRKVLVLAVVTLTVGLGNAGQDANKKDEEKIVGAWKIVSMEREGEKAPEARYKDITVVFNADRRITVEEPGKQQELKFKLNASKNPKEIDSVGPDNQVHKGIYVLDRDDLKVCINPAPDERPTEFATQAGTKTELIVLKRDKN